MRPNRHQIENMRGVVSEFIGEHRETIDEEYCGLSFDRTARLVARDFVEHIGIMNGAEGQAREGRAIDGTPTFRTGRRDGSDFVFETVCTAVLPFVREALRKAGCGSA